MQRLATVAVATALFAGAAAAQMKVTQTQPTTTSTPTPAAIATMPPAPLETARRIPRDEAIKLVKEDKAVFVDVRAKPDWDAGHIKGAIHIPLTELLLRIKDIPPRKMIITYCAWQQEHTSARAVLDLNAHGIKNTAALLGGWNDWKKANLPIETTPVTTTPMK
jgi:rhodanese-related sulfurtransferase